MKKFSEADGLKYILQQQCRKNRKKQFPNNDAKKYFDIYQTMEKYMNDVIHEKVNLGAAVHSKTLLNDHGVEHVKMVMKRAHEIMCESEAKKLTGYELFILLLAIHFHDVGNIEGREKHEEKIRKIMHEMGENAPISTIDKDMIAKVAMAHGGYVDTEKTNKDTIYELSDTEYNDSVPIKLRILAAVLRFADELAEGFTRSEPIVEIPDENKIYHVYSSVITVKNIAGDTVSLGYNIPYEYTQNKITRDNGDMYLYDYIIKRLEKCIQELEYCKKYAGGFICLTRISVELNIVMNEGKLEPLDSFVLSLRGYSSRIFSDYVDTRKNDDEIIKYSDGKALMSAFREGE